MTCRDTIEWLLEAEPGELEAPLNSGIAEHVASCQGCRARVARVVVDTAWLARTIPRSSALAPRASTVVPARSWRFWPAYVTSGLVAASLLVVLLTRTPGINPHATDRPQDRAIIPAPSHETGDSVAIVSSVSTRPSATPAAQRRSTVHPRVLPSERGVFLPSAHAIQAVALTPQTVSLVPERSVRLDTLSADSGAASPPSPRASFAIDATPSTGRYAVLRSTPQVTVVWFY